MASLDTLTTLRDELAHEIAFSICARCEKQHEPINVDEPEKCPCHCDEIDPFLQRLDELDRAIRVSQKYLTRLQPRKHFKKSA